MSEKEVLRRLRSVRVVSARADRGGSPTVELDMLGERVVVRGVRLPVRDALGLTGSSLGSAAAWRAMQEVDQAVRARLTEVPAWRARLDAQRRRAELRGRLWTARALERAIPEVAQLAADLSENGLLPDLVIAEVSSRIHEEFGRRVQES